MTQPSTSSNPKILYVEDEIIVALDVSDILSHDMNFEVELAHNLHTARKLVEDREFDYALLDINLGQGERSTELGRELAAKGVHVVFASGYNREELHEVADFPLIEKPFQAHDLRRYFGGDTTDLPANQDYRSASAAE